MRTILTEIFAFLFLFVFYFIAFYLIVNVMEDDASTEIITSYDGVMEQHEGWERPATPEMMEIRYDKYEGMSGKEIEDHLDYLNSHVDPNTLREEQIEQLEGLITGLDFWPAAVEAMKERQSLLAMEVNYTGRRQKHVRRELETILKECHKEIKSGEPCLRKRAHPE